MSVIISWLERMVAGKTCEIIDDIEKVRFDIDEIRQLLGDDHNSLIDEFTENRKAWWVFTQQ